MGATPTISRPSSPAPSQEQAPRTVAHNGGGPAEGTRQYWRLVLVALVVIVVASLIAAWIQTGGGAAQIKEVRFIGMYNIDYDGYLYIPNGVTADHPAPGILALHGFNNSKEYMANTALELARRGYVVLALDMDSHGYSEASNLPPLPFGQTPPNAIGAVDGLKYLRTLDVVDKGNVGLIGMSMGGMAADGAAVAMPDAYKALFFMDSGCTGGCATDKNYAVSVGTQTELAGGSWGAPNGAAVPSMPDLMKLFGTTKPIVPGQVYGSIPDGTGRVYYGHFGDHALSTDDTVSIGNAITWFGTALKGGSSLPSSDQIWPIKVISTGVAFIGCILLLLALGGLLLQTPFFRSLNDSVPAYKGNVGRAWWVFAIIAAAVGPALFQWAFPLSMNDHVPGPESVTNGFTGWLIIQGIITLAILVVGYFALAKKAGANGVSYGLTWEGKGLDWPKIGRSLLLALVVIASAYALLAVITAWLKVDFRFWVLTLKTTDFAHLLIMLLYVVPIGLYFFPMTVALHGTLRPQNGNATIARETITNVVILVIGVLVLLGLFYVPLSFFGTDAPPMGAMPLGMINFIALIGLMPVLAVLSTFFFRKTGRIYVSAFICTFFITWYLVAANTVWPF